MDNPICGACLRSWTACCNDPCSARNRIYTVVCDDGRVAVAFRSEGVTEWKQALSKSALFQKTTQRARRSVKVSKFEPGEHFYLEWPDAIAMPRMKYDSIAEAAKAAESLGYVLDSHCLIRSLSGTRIIPLTEII